MLSEGMLYALGVIIARGIGFVAIPIFTRVLSPAEYGRIDLIDTTSTVLHCVIGVAVTTALMHQYERRSDAKHGDQIIGSAMLGMGAMSVLTTAALWSVAPMLAESVLRDRSLATCLRLMFITTTLSGIVEIPLMVARARSRPGWFVAVSLIRTALGFALNIILVIWFRLGVAGVVWANFLTTGLCVLALAVPWVVHTRGAFSWPIFRAMLVYGLPAIPGSLAILVVHNGDRYILNRFASLTDVGTYSLGYKLGMLISYGIAVPFVQMWTGRVWRLAREPEGPRIFARVGTYYALILLFGWLGLASFSSDIVGVLAKGEFARAAGVIPMVAGAYAIREWAGFHKGTLLAAGRPGAIAFFEPVSAVVNIAATWILVARYGAWGAAAATALTMLVLFALTYPFAQAAYRIPYPVKRLALAAAAAAALYATNCAMLGLSTGWSLLVRALIVLCFLPAVVALGLVDPEDMSWLRARALIAARRFARAAPQAAVSPVQSSSTMRRNG